MAVTDGDDGARGAPPQPARVVSDVDGRGGAGRVRPRRGRRDAIDRRAGGEALMSSFESLSGIPVKALYTPEDRAGKTYEERLGEPGESPVTRSEERRATK